MTKQFETGKTYYTRSICDYECVFSFEILGRSAKTVTVNVNGKTVKRRLRVYEDVEMFQPFGSYSMAAVISANKEALQ